MAGQSNTQGHTIDWPDVSLALPIFSWSRLLPPYDARACVSSGDSICGCYPEGRSSFLSKVDNGNGESDVFLSYRNRATAHTLKAALG